MVVPVFCHWWTSHFFFRLTCDQVNRKERSRQYSFIKFVSITKSRHIDERQVWKIDICVFFSLTLICIWLEISRPQLLPWQATAGSKPLSFIPMGSMEILLIGVSDLLTYLIHSDSSSLDSDLPLNTIQDTNPRYQLLALHFPCLSYMRTFVLSKGRLVWHLT